jgi:hypothetical protein
MNYVPIVNFNKGIPDGIKKLIRKKMHMEVDYFFGKPYHKQHRLEHLLTSPVIPDRAGEVPFRVNPVFLSLRNASQVMMTFRLRCGNLKKYCHSLFFLSSLMCFFTVNPLIRRAVWAYAMLDSLDKPISEPSLLLSCFCAYRTFDAALGHFFIVETPIPKAKRSGIGKLNNPAQRRVYTRDLFRLRKLLSCSSS